MNLPILLYFTDLIGNFEILLAMIFFGFLAFFLILGFTWLVTKDDYDKEDNEQINKALKKGFSYAWIPILSLVINLFLPSKNTMYLMLGSYYLQSSTLPKKVANILEFKLDIVLDELKEKGMKKD